MKFFIILFTCVFILEGLAFGQVNKLLKKAQDLKSTELKDVVGKKQVKIDTANFSYAFAQLDNAKLYENEDNWKATGFSLLKNILDSSEVKDKSSAALDANRKGEFFYNNGRYGLAENNFLNAFAILTGSRGMSDKEVAALYVTQLAAKSKPQAAIEELKQSLRSALIKGLTLENLREFDALGQVVFIKILGNLALLYHTTGRYDFALQLTEKSLRLRESVYGTYREATLAAINNLAMLYKDLGQYDKAEELCNQALKTNAIPKDSPKYALLLNNRAVLMQVLGRHDKAKQDFEQALLLAKKEGEKSSFYLSMLVNEALLFQDIKQYDKAEQNFLKVIEIKQRRLGTAHPDYAHALTYLAALNMSMEKYDLVEKYLDQSISIYKRRFGIEHPSYLKSRTYLAQLYLKQQKNTEALAIMEEVLQLSERVLGTSHPDFVRALKLTAITYDKNHQKEKAASMFLSMVEKHSETVQKFFPSMSEEEKARLWNKIRPDLHVFYDFVVKNPSEQLLTAMYETHIATKGILLSTTFAARQAILSSQDTALIAQYRTWVDMKENLVRYYSMSLQELQDEKVNLPDYQNRINEIEKELTKKSTAFAQSHSQSLVRFAQVAASLKKDEAALEIISIRADEVASGYMVLVGLHQAKAPQMLVLPSTSEMEGKFYKYYINSIKNQFDDKLSYQNYWKAIEAKVFQCKKIFISSDGIYSQISLNTLRDEKGQYLLNKYQLVYLTNTRILGENTTKKQATQKSAVLVGFPDYGTQGEVEPLPGTKEEVQAIAGLLKDYQVTVLTEKSASEGKVKSISQIQLLHIATHGYFLPQQDAASDLLEMGTQVHKAKNDPLLRSGILLADCEAALRGQIKSSAYKEDGLLTAFEATALDLSQTELVILSACETGVGETVVGEGVYGLQRAFQLAGARSTAMSLWTVSDEATMQLMKSFYQNWLSGMPKQEAFRKAQQQTQSQFAHPYFWGAFILMGQ